MWSREPGFPTLIHIILEQQVSLASAKAAHDRLLAAASPLTPQRFLELDDARLKLIGFSRQKTAYGRHLAQSIVSGRLSLESLGALDDDAVKSELMKVKGIGSWTADIYLLMALGRRDAYPSGDLALAVAAREAKRLDARPTAQELEAVGEPWRPWRAVAARLLWHYYLNRTASNKSSG
jgi:DNA-3-methyladenine glycosylase II